MILNKFLGAYLPIVNMNYANYPVIINQLFQINNYIILLLFRINKAMIKYPKFSGDINARNQNFYTFADSINCITG